MCNYTIFGGFENPRRGRQARNLTTNVPKILDVKSSSEQIFSKNCRWVPLACTYTDLLSLRRNHNTLNHQVCRPSCFDSNSTRPFLKVERLSLFFRMSNRNSLRR